VIVCACLRVCVCVSLCAFVCLHTCRCHLSLYTRSSPVGACRCLDRLQVHGQIVHPRSCRFAWSDIFPSSVQGVFVTSNVTCLDARQCLTFLHFHDNRAACPHEPAGFLHGNPSARPPTNAKLTFNCSQPLLNDSQPLIELSTCLANDQPL